MLLVTVCVAAATVVVMRTRGRVASDLVVCVSRVCRVVLVCGHTLVGPDFGVLIVRFNVETERL